MIGSSKLANHLIRSPLLWHYPPRGSPKDEAERGLLRIKALVTPRHARSNLRMTATDWAGGGERQCGGTGGGAEAVAGMVPAAAERRGQKQENEEA